MTVAKSLKVWVPVRTDEQDEKLYNALRGGYTLSQAVKWAEYTWSDVRDWRLKDTGFDLAIRGAEAEGTDHLEGLKTEHAFRGYLSRRRISAEGVVTEEYDIAHGLAIPLLEARERRQHGDDRIYGKQGRQVVEHVGKDGGAIQTEGRSVNVNLDLQGVDDKTLTKAVLAMLAGLSEEETRQTLASLAGNEGED